VGFLIKINNKFPDRPESCNTNIKVIFQDRNRIQVGKQVREDGKRKEELKNKTRKMRSFGKRDFDGEVFC
jgi:hypothetical protein